MLDFNLIEGDLIYVRLDFKKSHVFQFYFIYFIIINVRIDDLQSYYKH